MKKRLLLFAVLSGCLSSLMAQESIADFLGENSQEICYFTGELATYGAATASFAVCLETGGTTCAVALKLLECAENPACNGIVSTITEKGCTYLIQEVEGALRVFGKTTKDNAEELQNTFKTLDTISGMTWLMKYLSR